jgi:ArsR family metal-binding transcriptional regulator
MNKTIKKYKYHALAALGLAGTASMVDFKLEPRAKDVMAQIANTSSEAIDGGISVIEDAIRGVEDVPSGKTLTKSMCDESGCIGITVVTKTGSNKRYLVTIEAQEIALETQKYGHLDDSNSIEYQEGDGPYDGFTDDYEEIDENPSVNITLNNYERKCKEYNVSKEGEESCKAFWLKSLRGGQ